MSQEPQVDNTVNADLKQALDKLTEQDAKRYKYDIKDVINFHAKTTKDDKKKNSNYNLWRKRAKKDIKHFIKSVKGKKKMTGDERKDAHNLVTSKLWVLVKEDIEYCEKLESAAKQYFDKPNNKIKDPKTTNEIKDKPKKVAKKRDYSEITNTDITSLDDVPMKKMRSMVGDAQQVLKEKNEFKDAFSGLMTRFPEYFGNQQIIIENLLSQIDDLQRQLEFKDKIIRDLNQGLQE